jgi:hypothetical protein
MNIGNYYLQAASPQGCSMRVIKGMICLTCKGHIRDNG